MTASTLVIEVDIDAEILEQATTVLAERGLTIPEVVRSMLIQTAQNKELPFEVLIPNVHPLSLRERVPEGRERESRSRRTLVTQ